MDKQSLKWKTYCQNAAAETLTQSNITAASPRRLQLYSCRPARTSACRPSHSLTAGNPNSPSSS